MLLEFLKRQREPGSTYIHIAARQLEGWLLERGGSIDANGYKRERCTEHVPRHTEKERERILGVHPGTASPFTIYPLTGV